MKKILLFASLIYSTILVSQADSLLASYNFNACNGADGVAPRLRGTSSNSTYGTDRFGNPGGALQTSGTGGMNFPANTKTLVSNGLTISAWIKPSTLSGQQAIVSKWIGSQTQDQYILMLNGNKVMVAVGNPSASASGHMGNIVLTANVWHHIVFTWDPTGRHQIYVNGVLDLSTVNTSFTTINNTSSTAFTLGYQSNGSRYYSGLMDDIKLFNQKLDDTEIQSLYTENTAVQNNLVSHYNFDLNINDITNYNDAQGFGLGYASDRNGNAGQAINISNDSTHLNLYDSYDGFAAGATGKISYSFWVNFKSFTGTYQILLGKSADAGCSGNDRQFLLRLNTQNKLDMTIYSSTGPGNYGIAIGSTTFTTGQWYHVVVSYDAIQSGPNKVKMYVNGVAETISLGTPAGAGFSNGYANANAPIGIGAYLRADGNFCVNTQRMNAYFDDLMIFNDVLNATEVDSIHAVQSPIGLKSLVNFNSIIAYPNPFSEKISATIDLDSEIQVLSIDGKIVYLSPVKSGEFTLNTTDWNNGLYILKIQNTKGSSVQKLIKQ